MSDELALLNKQYLSATKTWNETYPGNATGETAIARYREWPGWTFAPRFLAFGESAGSAPEGLEALSAIVEMGTSVGEYDRELFPHYERQTN